MADDRLTPTDIKLLIESGDLTHDTVQGLYTSDPRAYAVAKKMLIDTQGREVMGDQPAIPSWLTAGPGNLGPKLASAAASIPSAVTGIGAQMGVDFIGQKMGLPWYITGPISSAVGSMTRGRASKPTSAPKPAKRDPRMGIQVPSMPSRPATPNVPSSPSGPPPRESTPRNFERHGNVTSPGPDARRGGGGPSRPDSPPYNPLEDKRKLDVGPRPGQPDRRQMYEEMKAGLPDPPGFKQARARSNATRQSPSEADFDEGKKREAMFGGLHQGNKNYIPPSARGPLSQKDIEQMIKNMLRISEQMR